MTNYQPTIEHQRLEAQRQGEENWRLWGPYLAERACGIRFARITVRTVKPGSILARTGLVSNQLFTD